LSSVMVSTDCRVPPMCPLACSDHLQLWGLFGISLDWTNPDRAVSSRARPPTDARLSTVATPGA
jgi:hypothetical protein